MKGIIFILGFTVLVYVLIKGFKVAYNPPTLAVNAGNPAFTIQV